VSQTLFFYISVFKSKEGWEVDKKVKEIKLTNNHILTTHKKINIGVDGFMRREFDESNFVF
jgi:hypothetical protein